MGLNRQTHGVELPGFLHENGFSCRSGAKAAKAVLGFYRWDAQDELLSKIAISAIYPASVSMPGERQLPCRARAFRHNGFDLFWDEKLSSKGQGRTPQ